MGPTIPIWGQIHVFDIEINRLLFLLLLMLKIQFIFHPYKQDFFLWKFNIQGKIQQTIHETSMEENTCTIPTENAFIYI